MKAASTHKCSGAPAKRVQTHTWGAAGLIAADNCSGAPAKRVQTHTWGAAGLIAADNCSGAPAKGARHAEKGECGGHVEAPAS